MVVNTGTVRNPSQCIRRGIFLSVIVAFVGQAFSLLAEDWDVGGHIYTNVRVQEVTPATVTIFHSKGVVQLKLSELPRELQERFNLDAEKAKQWTEHAEGELATTRDEAENRKRAMIESHRASASDEASPGVSARSSNVGQFIAELEESEIVEYRPEVDLRAAFRESSGKVKRPGKHPGCSIFAVTGALEFEIRKRTGSAWPLADPYLIWAVRDMYPDIPIDDGSHLFEVVAALRKYGVPIVQNYEVAKPDHHGWVKESKPAEGSFEQFRPTERSIAAAGFRDAVSYWISPENPRLIELLVTLLNQETPVIVGVGWPHPNALKTNNLLRDQEPADMRGHSVVLVGYRNPEGKKGQTTFIFRNSYGDTWGLGGFGLMDETYLRKYFLSALYLELP